MSEPNIVYENNDQAAHAVQEFVRKKGDWSFTLRPFNRFATAFTAWWIVPTSEWPAYKYGKLCFHRYDGVLYTGYYVEKGLGVQLAGLSDVQKRHIIQSDWRWHDLVYWASEGKVDKIVEQVCDLSQTSVRVLVEIHAFNEVPEPDSERTAPSDAIEFEIAFSDSRWRLIRPGQSTLAKFNRTVSIADLMEGIIDEKDLDYFWMDMVIGVRLRYGDGLSPGWNASDIWAKALQPWVEFVR